MLFSCVLLSFLREQISSIDLILLSCIQMKEMISIYSIQETLPKRHKINEVLEQLHVSRNAYVS